LSNDVCFDVQNGLIEKKWQTSTMAEEQALAASAVTVSKVES
jgi:hypothetical protein